VENEMNVKILFTLTLLAILPTSTIACGRDVKEETTPTPVAAPFSMEVFPQELLQYGAIPGQRCVFMVRVAEQGEGGSYGQAVSISATAPDASVTVEPKAITPSQVAEVTIIPHAGGTSGAMTEPAREQATIEAIDPEEGKTLTATIRGERSGLERSKTVPIEVFEGADLLRPYATELRDRFVLWLEEHHPELDITTETDWIPTTVRPGILIVMYYLFLSDDWEMGLRWHVMIPPYDWAEIYLRHRFAEVNPSYAFKISSLEAQDEPQAVEPEDSVWR
jgi:hypothetical protein